MSDVVLKIVLSLNLYNGKKMETKDITMAMVLQQPSRNVWQKNTMV